MAKKITAAEKVRSYLLKDPKAPASEVARKCGTKVGYVNFIRHKLRKEAQTPVRKPRVFAAQPAVVTMELVKPITVATDMVNHPPHYKVGGIETIDFIEAKGLNYRLGNVVKYVTRADHKGERLENLKKAQWYLEREISHAQGRTGV